MRTFGWSFASLLAAAPLVAQQPPQPPAKQAAPFVVAPAPAPAPRVVTFNPQTDPLDKLLVQWEAKLKGLQSIVSNVVRTETEQVSGDKTVYEGSIKLLRPDRADLYLARKGKPTEFDRYLCTGKYLYEFRPTQKLIRVHTLPPRAPGQSAVDDGFLSFIFGIDAKVLKNRYDITLMKQDANYAYLHVKSVAISDKQEFTEARLAIYLPTMMPTQMIFVPPNGNTMDWYLSGIDTAKALTANDFVAPTNLPKEWQMQQVPAARTAVPPPSLVPASVPPTVPPTKVRPSGN